MHGTNRAPFVDNRPFGAPSRKRRAANNNSRISEDAIHRAVVDNLRARAVPGVVWWHSPNGGKRGLIEAARFKALGVRPGVADICAVHRGHFYALELKADDGRPTVEQMQFIQDVNATGGHGVICHGLDRALRVLECWGLLRGTT